MQSSDEKFKHIQCAAGEVAKYLILTADPFGADEIAKRLDNPKLLAHNREMRSFSGSLSGAAVTAAACGHGASGGIIGIEEYLAAGAEVVICADRAARPNGMTGDGFVANCAVRGDSASLCYVPSKFPAVADLPLALAVKRSAGDGYRFAAVYTVDSYYRQELGGQRPSDAEINKLNIGGFDSLSSGLFIVAGIRKKRAASIFSYISRDDAFDRAVAAVRALAENGGASL